MALFLVSVTLVALTCRITTPFQVIQSSCCSPSNNLICYASDSIRTRLDIICTKILNKFQVVGTNSLNLDPRPDSNFSSLIIFRRNLDQRPSSGTSAVATGGLGQYEWWQFRLDRVLSERQSISGSSKEDWSRRESLDSPRRRR